MDALVCDFNVFIPWNSAANAAGIDGKDYEALFDRVQKLRLHWVWGAPGMSLTRRLRSVASGPRPSLSTP